MNSQFGNAGSSTESCIIFYQIQSKSTFLVSVFVASTAVEKEKEEEEGGGGGGGGGTKWPPVVHQWRRCKQTI